MFSGFFRKLSRTALALALLLNVSAVASGFKLAAFGDSLMDGYGLSATDGFIPKMQEELTGLGVAVEVTDHANSGDTTADGLTRITRVLNAKPDGVLLALGSNDALRRISPSATRDNLDAMLRRFGEAGVPVMLIGAQAPLNWGLKYKGEFDGIYGELAMRYGVSLYPFILAGVVLNPALNQSDGVHPNTAGIDVIVDRMAPSILEFISQVNER